MVQKILDIEVNDKSCKLLTETTILHLCHYTMEAIKLMLNHFTNIN